MSAYFVSKPTIDAAMTLCMAHEKRGDAAFWTARGRQIWQANADAVCHRYHDTGSQEFAGNIADYTFTARLEGEAFLLKQLSCLLYQCSEGDIAYTVPVGHLHRVEQHYRDLYFSKGTREAWGDNMDTLTFKRAFNAAPWGVEDDLPLLVTA